MASSISSSSSAITSATSPSVTASVPSTTFSVPEMFYSGLQVDKSYVENKIKEIGILNTARVIGYEVQNPDYLLLSGRLLMFHIQHHAPRTIKDYLVHMGHRLNQRVKTFMETHQKVLDDALEKAKKNDYRFDWFSGATMWKTYLARPYYDEEPVETPQMMYLRKAAQMYADEGVEMVLKTFYDLSEQYYTHASPTIFNAGMKKPQMSSCFLYTIEDDLKSILGGVVEGGLISKLSGGLGLDISRIRHSEIGTVGASAGIVPMLRLYNEMVRYCDQGGKRKGAITIYLRPHHIDIFEFIDVVKKTGDQYSRAHDINTAIWFPWIFWKRVRTNDKWTLFCPAKTPLLNDVWGTEFEKNYEEYERLCDQREKNYLQLKKRMEKLDQLEPGKRPTNYTLLKEEYLQAKRDRITHRVVHAREVLDEVIKTQRKAGMPYVMHGDACNMKSNQKNLGMIRSSNLCVSPDTLILTEKGYIEIGKHVDQQVNVWNGSTFSSVTIKNTGKVNKLLKITLSNGLFLKCTEEHKFLMASGPNGSNLDPTKSYRLEARRLFVGDKLSNFLIPNGFQDPQNVDLEAKKSVAVVRDLTVTHIETIEGETDTFCFTEPLNNAGIFNGILTGQCLEIIEHTSKDEIASCLTGDTLIQTKNGIQRLDSFEEAEVYVPYNNDDDLEEPEDESTIGSYVLAKRINQGVKPVYQLELTNGTILKSTADHKFLTVQDNEYYEWKEMKDLTRSDRLVMRSTPQKVKWDFHFTEGTNICENELFEQLPTLQGNSQRSLFLGFLFTNYHQSNGFFTIYMNYGRMFLPYFLDLGIVPLFYENPTRVVISGISAKNLSDHFELPFDDEVEEQHEFTSNVSGTPQLIGEEQVWDLYVPDRHHFVANGVVTHNCNLASISLKKFAKGYVDHTKPFEQEMRSKVDFAKLGEVSESVTRNLNKVIDHNFYPLDDFGEGYFKEGKISSTNKKHRPLGIGVSGLAELIYGLDLLPDSEETRLVNKAVFACMYYHSLVESVKLALIHGPYDSFEGSPMSQGKLQFDLWKEEFAIKGGNAIRKSEDDEPLDPSVWGEKEIQLVNGDVIEPTWDSLKKAIMKNGCRNSLHIALMPTAGTSAVIAQGATETTEFPMANLYSRKLMNGAYPIVNYFLCNDLRTLGLWNESTAQFLSANDGSLKGYSKFIQLKNSDLSAEVLNRVQYLERKYATMWELKQSWLLKLTADRGRYVDQSQSTNIYLADPTDDQLRALHLQTDMLGLKTGMYYLRSKGAMEPIKFTTDPEIMNFVNNNLVKNTSEPAACNRNDPQCLSCQ
jgi:ribonucleotide reductase alpha subunit